MIHDQAGRRWHGARRCVGGFVFGRRGLLRRAGSRAAASPERLHRSRICGPACGCIRHPTLQANGEQMRGDPESLREGAFGIRSHKRTNPGRDRYSFELLLHKRGCPSRLGHCRLRSNLNIGGKVRNRTSDRPCGRTPRLTELNVGASPRRTALSEE